MKPIQILGIIAGSTAALLGFVVVLVMLGMPTLFAFFGVYLMAILIMIRMQKSADKAYDDREIVDHQAMYIDSTEHVVCANNLSDNEHDIAIKLHA